MNDFINDLNSILIEGELEFDPSLSETDKGIKVCNLQITSRRYYTKQDGTKTAKVNDFVVQIWGKLAQTCSDNLRSGRKIRVVGRIEQCRWTDKDGQSKNRVEIIAEHIEFCPAIKAKEGA
jgi:single-strand DNA-binding protein